MNTAVFRTHQPAKITERTVTPSTVIESLKAIYPSKQPACLQRQTCNAARPFRAMTSENKRLLQSDDSFLLGVYGESALRQMRDCSSRSPCKIIGCPKCSYSRAAHRIAKTCNTISDGYAQMTSDAHNVVISCDSWETTPNGIHTVSVQEMRGALEAIQDIPGVLGYTATMDAYVDKNIAEQLSHTYPDRIERLTHTPYRLHWHIVVATVPGFSSDRLKREIEQNLVLRGYNASADTNPIQFDDGRKKHWAGSYFGLMAYNEKLSICSKFKADETRMLQRAFCGVNIHDDWGIFSPTSKAQDAWNGLLHISHASHLMDGAKRILGLLASKCRKAIGLAKPLAIQCQKAYSATIAAWRRHQKVLQNRRSRRERALAQLRKRFSGDLLRQKIAEYDHKSQLQTSRQNNDWLTTYQASFDSLIQSFLDLLFFAAKTVARSEALTLRLIDLWQKDPAAYDLSRAIHSIDCEAEWFNTDSDNQYLAMLRARVVYGLLGYYAWSYRNRMAIKKYRRQGNDAKCREIFRYLAKWSDLVPSCNPSKESPERLNDTWWREAWANRALAALR